MTFIIPITLLSTLLIFASAQANAITISCDQNLQFGTIIAPVSNAAASVTLNLTSDIPIFTGNASSTGNLLPLNSANNPTAAQRGKCTVTGTMGEAFTVASIISNGDITYTVPTSPLQIPNNSTSTIFYIGGILDLQTNNSGSQTQNFSVTVTSCTYNATNNTCT
ncbi:MAG: DUF4402 domain-containing protein [Gammaproteobacteria bacterium]|nr:DUF4402 domain-containing protein [Gammaproteobacteria bacterium]